MSETDQSRQRDESARPEVEDAHDHAGGGEVSEDRADSVEYRGPDPERDNPGQGDDEDQGV